MSAIQRVLDIGVARVVLGTVTVHNPSLVKRALATFGPERILMGIDARDGMVRIRGWQETTGIEALDLAVQWSEWGGTRLVFTDISRDGMGSGVNVRATAALAVTTGLQVIASGGVGAIADVLRVKEAALAGVIIGRALYEGQIELEQALKLSRS
jgi:phosphoribosylformimino-5-aminoimidazole carboxamide ribotide isomerase